MNNKKLLFLYISWGFLSLLLFFYLLFPKDLLSQFITKVVEDQLTDIQLDFESVEPVLPPGVKFNDIDIYYHDDLVYKADYLKVAPGLISLFSDRKSIGLSAFAYKGSWKFKTKFSENDFWADAHLKEIRVDLLPLRTFVPDYRFSGIVNFEGTCRLEEKNLKNADVKMDAKNFAIRFSQRMFGIRRLLFNEVKVDIKGKDNTIQVNTFEITGKQISGNAEGTVSLKQPYGKSILDLKGTVTPDAGFISKLGRTMPIAMMLGNKNAKDGIPFTLKGTIDEPDFVPEI